MIYVAFNHITFQLNQYLKRTFSLHEDIAIVSNLVDLNGTVTPQNNNKIIVSLVNVEKDTLPRQPLRGANAGTDQVVGSIPALYLNLYVLIASNFSGNNYPEALKFLSAVIGFLHRMPVFDHTTTPDLDPRIERLKLEMDNLEFHDQSNLWGVVGGKYIPSVLYKVKMIAINTDDVTAQIPTVRKPDSEIQP